jgi:hypothetical protein
MFQITPKILGFGIVASIGLLSYLCLKTQKSKPKNSYIKSTRETISIFNPPMSYPFKVQYRKLKEDPNKQANITVDVDVDVDADVNAFRKNS